MAEVYDDADFQVTDSAQRAIIIARAGALLEFNMDTAMALVEAGMRDDRAVTVAVNSMLRTAAALAASVAMDFFGRDMDRARWDDATGRAFDGVKACIDEKKAVTDAG